MLDGFWCSTNWILIRLWSSRRGMQCMCIHYSTVHVRHDSSSSLGSRRIGRWWGWPAASACWPERKLQRWIGSSRWLTQTEQISGGREDHRQRGADDDARRADRHSVELSETPSTAGRQASESSGWSSRRRASHVTTHATEPSCPHGAARMPGQCVVVTAAAQCTQYGRVEGGGGGANDAGRWCPSGGDMAWLIC
jgi:hypothetical protein